MDPFISICIPAKDRVHLLRRLLDSISEQTYNDFEVIITDNSEGNDVESLTLEFARLNIKYAKNNPKTQMGGNWNACMQKASGKWIKLIHDDDWFTDKDSLAVWAQAAQDTNASFIFSSYYLVDEDTLNREQISVSFLGRLLLKWSFYSLLKENVIGPPSVTLIRRDAFLPYLPQLNWLVDIECYIRYIKSKNRLKYIALPITSIGIHKGQATNKYFRNPTFEIPEILAIVNPYYPGICRNFFAYDYCWRLVRNLQIKDSKVFESYAAGLPVPNVFEAIIHFQRRFSNKLLANGLASKLLMSLHWVFFNLKK
jgi:glycosyltransferase involved in cell wall biosynthesis